MSEMQSIECIQDTLPGMEPQGVRLGTTWAAITYRHEAIIGAYVLDEEGERAGLECVCECGLVLIESAVDEEFLPFAEIADAVRAHQEALN